MEDENAILPSWLPPMVSIDGDIDDVIPRLHDIFIDDFFSNKKTCFGLPVNVNATPDREDTIFNYELGFWHLIAHNDPREYEHKRAIRLPWCGAIIQNASDPAILKWHYKEASGKIRTYLWLREQHYAVILQCGVHSRTGENVYFLITAFCVNRAKEDELMRKYRDRIPV